MSGPRFGRFGWLQDLSVRIVVMLGLALLPIGMIAVWQTTRVEETAVRNAELALLALSEQAAQEDRLSIQRAFGAANMLGVMLPRILDTPEACTDLLRGFLEREPDFSFVGVLPVSGLMECSSTGETFDFSGFPNFDATIAAARPTIEVNTNAPLSGTSVIIVSHPFELDGAFAGFVSISVPQGRLSQDGTAPDSALFDGLVELLSFNQRGDLLAAQGAMSDAAQVLPRQASLSEILAQDDRTFRATAANGENYLYTVAFIEGSPLIVVGVWDPSRVLSGGAWANTLPPAVFPVLMWVASLIVAVMAIYRFVIRHITRLRRQMDVFADTRLPPSAPISQDTPNEIAALQNRFLELTESILNEEARLEKLVREKNVLLKEVHHRVKNNLQMIASIMNMQIRAAEHEETVKSLEKIQSRVTNLASIHRDLYVSQDGSRVDAARLIDDIFQKSVAMAVTDRASLKVEKDIEPVMLFPDQAVPLSLLVAEVTINALKYLGASEDGERRIALRLWSDGTTCHFHLSNTIGDAPDSVGTGIGNRLIRAFAIKLGAELEAEERDGTFVVSLSFPIAEFEAEPSDF